MTIYILSYQMVLIQETHVRVIGTPQDQNEAYTLARRGGVKSSKCLGSVDELDACGDETHSLMPLMGF